MTRYRFARTLHEAFPCDAEAACAITVYRRPRWPYYLLIAVFITLGIITAVIGS